MSGLHALQQQFLGAISSAEPGSVQSVLSTELLSAADRVSIYHYAYFKRLTAVLEDDYPAVRAMLGDDAFVQLARQYTLTHPSQHTSIRWFGEYLPDFLSQHDPYRQYGLLAELAEWERRLRQMFDAEDAAPATLSLFQSIPVQQWPDLTFQFIPAFILCRHQFNSVAIWRAIKDEQIPPEVQTIEDKEYWLIWRAELQTSYQSISQEEAYLIEQVQQGACFAELCDTLADHHGDHTAQVAIGLLQKWTSAGMLTSICVKP